jgi:hypothetical protein
MDWRTLKYWVFSNSAYFDSSSVESILFGIVIVQLSLFIPLAFQIGDVGSVMAIYQEEELTLASVEEVDKAEPARSAPQP